MNKAEELNIPTVMADRAIQVTLKRAWAKNSFWGKNKLLSALFASAFSKEEYSAQEIEDIKNKNEMDSMMNELAEYLPVVKTVLIDERNEYLATKIWNAEGKNVVAVLGAGHLDGVEENLKKLSDNTATIDMEEINRIPPKGIFGKIILWVIPVAIIALIVAGFAYGGSKLGTKMIKSWVLWNGIFAAAGTMLAAGNLLTIVTAFVSAPITSLCPFIGCGFVTAIVQALINKPKVEDMNTLQDDVNIRGFYKNRILRVLLVFVLSSIGSSIATFIGLGDISTSLANSNKTEEAIEMQVEEIPSQTINPDIFNLD